jgi:retron-type reverse transcriptase
LDGTSSYLGASRFSFKQAVRQAQAYVKEGKCFVVDLDIEKFFDRVNHDILMHRLRAVVDDVRVRTLIGRYPKAGVMTRRCWRISTSTRWTGSWKAGA